MTEPSDNHFATPAETMELLREARGGAHPLVRARLVANNEIPAAVRAVRGGAVLDAGEAGTLAAQRADSGVKLSAVEQDITALSKRIGFLNEQLSRHSFDRRTGAKVSALPPHIEAAHRLELASLNEELSIAHTTQRAVLVRDANNLARAKQRDEAEEIAIEFHGHDRERAEALRKAMLDEEARLTARRVLALKYGVG